MSPDTVFAAQMWGWPDAVIKRDAHGAVLFVNATFLALYGGRVEDWQGMAVTGWSAPPAAGQAQRFETRIPSADSSEIVYDWLEAAGPDGSAVAIARDVTPLLPRPGDTADTFQSHAFVPPVEQLPAIAASSFEAVMQAPAAEIPAAEAPAAAHAAAAHAAAPAVQAPIAPVFETPPGFNAPGEPPVSPPPVAQDVPPVAHVESAPVHAAPVEVAHVEAAHVEAAPAIDMTDFMPPQVDAYPSDAYTSDAPVAQSSVAHTTHEAASVEAPAPDQPAEAQPAPPQEERREFERRALPIEDGSAVLGNNWRDAVIAKAVGAHDPVVDDEPAPEAPALAATDTIRILLAEDNAINALLTRTLLEAEGCHVDTVEDGQLAVEAMKVNAYDLIFMDMRMPNMDGLEATRKIRQMNHASKGLPIVALTANAFDDDRNACFDAGMNDFMTKPVSAEELSEMVAQWTGPQAQQKLAS